jgi:hypothetical protein
MQAAAALQASAELAYAKDMFAKNTELCTQLGLRTLALTVANESIVSLKAKVAALETSLEEERANSLGLKTSLEQERGNCLELEALLEEERARIREYEVKDEAQDRLSEEIWGRREPSFSDPLPVLLDSPCTAAYMDQPLQLGRVVRDMGFVCRPTELRKLGALVYNAFTRVYGIAPVARVFHGKDGTPQRVCCFTRRDRDLVINVIMENRDTLFCSTLGQCPLAAGGVVVEEHDMD